jgi:co-chaperonin GroES (HSP10)
MTRWQPLRSNCIVSIKKGEERSSGGIITQLAGSRDDMAREEGTIIALGPDMFIDSADGSREQVGIGEVVAFARYGGKTLGTDENGNEIRALRDVDLIAKRIEG